MDVQRAKKGRVNPMIRQKGYALLVVVLTIVSMIPLAVAAGGSAEQVQNLRAELARLSEIAPGEETQDEIRQALTWLAEAETLLERREPRRAEYRLRRVDQSIDLIQALVEVERIDASTAEQRERYEEAQAEIARLEVEIRELEARKAEREAQLLRLRSR